MNKSIQFRGAYVTLITPFKDDESIDEACLKRLVNRQVACGIRGICPTGVTGETAALTDDEKFRVWEIVHAAIDGRVQHFPDIGTECLDRTMKLAKKAEHLGVDGVICLTPYLDLPTEAGMFQYFTRLADAIRIPLILHNVPGRTNVNMSPALITRLADHGNIIGIKDGSPAIEHLSEVLMLTRNKDFSVLTGKDTIGLPLLKLGGHGHVSVAANLIPEAVIGIVEACAKGDFETAEGIFRKYYAFFVNQYIETNPIATKFSLNTAGIKVGTPRIPLTPLSEKGQSTILPILKELNLVR